MTLETGLSAPSLTPGEELLYQQRFFSFVFFCFFLLYQYVFLCFKLIPGFSDWFNRFGLDGPYRLDWFVLQHFPSFPSVAWAHMCISSVT